MDHDTVLRVTSRCRRLTPPLALVAFLVMAAAPMAQASHLRPRGATPVLDPLVIAYERCTTPDTMHGVPIPLKSCTSPQQTSKSLTVGTPDAPGNGAGANSVGFVRLDVKINTSSPNDVAIDAEITDVRCLPATSSSVCNPGSSLPNAAGGPDYTGRLQASFPLRISDHYYDDGSGNFTAAATVSDATFEVRIPINVPCSATDSPTNTPAGDLVGSECKEITTENAIIPGSVQSLERANAEMPGPLQIFDGGPDGDVSTSPNTLFEQQGVFVP
jgi:hypothetical protein